MTYCHATGYDAIKSFNFVGMCLVQIYLPNEYIFLQISTDK